MEGVLKFAPELICPTPDLVILATPASNSIRVGRILTSQSMARGFAEGTMEQLAAKVDTILHGVEALVSVQEMCAQQPQNPLVKAAILNGHVKGITNDQFNGGLVQKMVWDQQSQC